MNRQSVIIGFIATALMPLELSVSVKALLEAEAGPIYLRGRPYRYEADAIDPGDVPPGIQLPPDGEGGLSSAEASISGRYADVEKDGQKAWHYDLRLIPGVPLPIEVLIYTKNKK